jgi:DNA-binding response OmpR family regulator
MNILIVEDEQNLGNTLSEYLEMKGHQVKWAENCAKAQSYFDIINWDVLLMDIGLPDGNGLDLARKFRKLKPRLKKSKITKKIILKFNMTVKNSDKKYKKIKLRDIILL